MDCTGDIDRLIDGILSAGAATVVLGPAACGKSSVALALYRRYQKQGRSACLFLVPNSPAARQVRRTLLAGSPSGILVSPQVLTFASLAERILSAAGDTGRVLSPFRRHVMLASVVQELRAAGKLRVLEAVADTPGLVVTLDKAIAELKRAAVEPATLRRALGRGGGKAADLLAVYSRYQELLHAGDAYDVEGRMWQARDCLSGDRPAGLDEFDAVVADGFTDFTPTQLEMLALLARRGRGVLVTLPHADDGRERLWHWTARTLANIRKAFGGKVNEVRLDGEPRDGPPLRRLWGRIFDFDAATCELPAGLTVIAAPGIDAEVAAVARRIKRLLLEGGGRAAVLARSMDAYRPVIERTFAEHDIPLAAAPQALADVPIIRFVLDVAALPPALAFRDVLGVLKSSYFRPQALGDFNATCVAAAEMLIREGNVLSGREAYASAAERLARRTPRAEADEGEQAVVLGPFAFPPETIRAAGRMLGRLFDLAPPDAPLAERIAAIVEGLALRQVAGEHRDAALAARDLRALEALREALAELEGADVSPAQLRAALAEMNCPGARSESLVDVMDVLDARSLRYEHVFLLGLGEGQFPYRFVEGPLVSEADRLAWAQRGIVLDNRGDLTAREMLLFYLGVSRADVSLTVSFLESDAAGRPGAASSFLEWLLTPAGGLEGDAAKAVTETLRVGQFVPRADEVASRRDAVNAAFGSVFGEVEGDGRPAWAWVLAQDASVVACVSAGLWAQVRRDRRGPCDGFDGRITDPALLETLERRFGPEAVFSATELSTYGQCPWQFFASYVLELAELREPQRRLEPVARGIFCHDVLFRVMQILRGPVGEPVRLHEIDEPALTDALAQAVAAAAADIEAAPPPYPALWQLQRDQMHAELGDYLLAVRANRELAAEGIAFELGFGMVGRAGGSAERMDPASRDEPVAVRTPGAAVRIRGKIDRVDRVTFDGRVGLLVVDYKTGRAPGKADIQAGRNVQAPLYAAAAEQILGAPALGGAFHRIGATDGKYEKLFAVMKSYGGRYIENKDHDRIFGEAMAAVGRFVEGIRTGHFDLLPTHDCPSYCPFRRICRFSEPRAELKAPPPQEAQP